MKKLRSAISLMILCAMVFTSIGGIGYNFAFGVYLEPCEDDCTGECCVTETDCTGDEFCTCEECSSIDDSLPADVSFFDPEPAYVTLGLTEIQQFVSRLYLDALGRPYDIAGYNYWVNRLDKNTISGARIAHSFFFSPEFINAKHSDDVFLYRLYKTLFGRDPDKGGEEYWLYQLTLGMPRESIFAGLIASPEFTKLCEKYDIERGSFPYTPSKDVMIQVFVTRLYLEVLERKPDTGGLNYWSGLLKNGITGASVAHSFFFSNEFRKKPISNAEFVDLLYSTLLSGSKPDAAGRKSWINRLDTGWPRENVFAGFVNSTEFNGICQKSGIVRGTYNPPAGGLQRAFVTRLYIKALNRSTPDTTGLNFWTNRLLSGTTGAQVAYDFIFSQEMINRDLGDTQFVNMLYDALLARSADASGRAYWEKQLDNGASRYNVFASFVISSEFDRLCRDHGITRGSAPAPTNTMVGNDMESRVWNIILLAEVNGISDRPAHIAGIIGNMRCGTGYNLCPFQIHIADQVGLGLLQWTGARQIAMENYMWANGISRVEFYEQMEEHIHKPGGICDNPITVHKDAAFLNRVLRAQVNFMFHEIRNTDEGLYLTYINKPTHRTGLAGAISYAELFCALAVRSGPGRLVPGDLFNSDTIQDLGVLLALQESPYVGGAGVLNRISFHILADRRWEANNTYLRYLRNHK